MIILTRPWWVGTKLDEFGGFQLGRLARTTGMTPEEVLRGLAPDLIINLAQMAPSDPRDLAVTLQLMPFGDRTALLAYGAIDYDKRRGVKVLPLFYDLTAAALDRVCEWARATGFSG